MKKIRIRYLTGCNHRGMFCKILVSPVSSQVQGSVGLQTIFKFFLVILNTFWDIVKRFVCLATPQFIRPLFYRGSGPG
ncbi:MAG: hypothetical protein QME44_03640, partial [Thermodesulfobacteriota bacterium]|nr:hypothetical protein [Thermodesulfobacteriota bacterium]